ncbi:hypothetical protein [Natrarchaeobaculum aegyptiacum]|uniref:Uncharacterized protein n=1 Tax=Natrarchaeobaculum aegyptiacum TaxID=745377 RepID=A0A2Z2HY21_9EURY|nr:hypothetical protein [Natrarchaeobaculum aegyptiacum]ARS91205.1 hypothetical protein B1756_16710 [Natrarchaeobaculum aegyptiacum]
MSHDRPNDQRASTGRDGPAFYLPGTPTSSTSDLLERLLKTLFSRRGRVRADRKRDRTNR